MEQRIQFVHREHQGEKGKWDNLFTMDVAERTKHFHESIPGYQPTVLEDLGNLAQELGLGALYVKDESSRFGLNAFKSLGGSYCIANYLAEKLGLDELTFSALQAPEVQDQVKHMAFVTATDGNHGRGVAWTAHILGAKSYVFMPKGSAPERLHNIQALGAEASITDFNYDDTVRYARDFAEKHVWPLIQDTAWPGYEKIPSLIMQGYLTLAMEMFTRIPEPPTHLFLQAGVGSMAAAVAAFAANYYGENRPIVTIVEPDKADCIFQTARADDGKLHRVTGALNSIMAGLSCGEPSTIAWEELAAHADFFISMPDYVAAKGMRILGAPLPGDARIISGESGASTTGLVAELMQNPQWASIRDELGLNEQSRVLCISTEGATDRVNYRRIVWDGLYPGENL